MDKITRHPPIISKVPHFVHGGDYNPDQWMKWKDTIWKEDMRLAKLAGINSLTVGIFSWAALEPEEGRYEFAWMDEILGMMADNGLTAVLSTPSGARPAWMSQKYPEVLRVDRKRRRLLHGGRHNHCWTSPVYREKVTAMNTALAKRYLSHPALGLWHISNEYGGECHCPLCQERFRGYLKARYGTLDALNEAWWTSFWAHTYTDWEQLESPGPLGESGVHGHNLDWMRFTTEQAVDFYLCETAPLKAITPDIPCTTNLMGTYKGLDYFRLAQALDVVSWDAYPQWSASDRDIETGAFFSFFHDLTRSLKGKPFMLMESSPSATNWRPVTKLHRPRVHMLQSMQAIAHGADTIQYFQYRKSRGSSEKFHGAVIDHEGTENTRVFRDVAEVGARLAGMDAIVGTVTPAQTAIVYDWQIRWALDDIMGFLQGKTNYHDTVIAHYKAFWKQGIPVDVIDSSVIAGTDINKYRLVAAPMLYMLRPGVAGSIRSFVQQGGTFVATYICGQVNESDLTFLGGFPGPLRETLGIWCEEVDSLYPEDRNTLVWKDKRYETFDFCELIHAENAAVLGTYGGDFYAGRPALTVNSYGRGKAYFIAARTGSDFLDDFYRAAAGEAGVKRALAAANNAPLPKGVTAQIRTDGEKDYIFLLNFTPAEAQVNVSANEVKTLAPYESVIIERKRE